MDESPNPKTEDMAATIAAPDIFSFLDYRAFLKAWFEARKSARPRFSHRLFVRLAGHSSPSLLNDVIRGRRSLGPTTAEGFCRAMKLSRPERRFFLALVCLDQAETDHGRNEAWETVAATRRFRQARRLEGDAVECLSRWYHAAIRELVRCRGFRRDPQWIARRLRPKITTSQARRAVQTLLRLGLLAEDGVGLKQADASLVTPHEVAGLAAANYHRAMLERAAAGIEAFPGGERRFGGVTVAVPESLIPRLRRELVDFQDHLLNLCDGADQPADRVLQIGLHFFPLSAAGAP